MSTDYGIATRTSSTMFNHANYKFNFSVSDKIVLNNESWYSNNKFKDIPSSNEPTKKTQSAVDWLKRAVTLFMVLKPAEGQILTTMPFNKEADGFLGGAWAWAAGSGEIWRILPAVIPDNSLDYGANIYNKEGDLIFSSSGSHIRIVDRFNKDVGDMRATSNSNVLNTEGKYKWVFRKTYDFVPAVIPVYQYSVITREGGAAAGGKSDYTVFRRKGNTLEIGIAIDRWVSGGGWFEWGPTAGTFRLIDCLIIDSATLK